MFGIRAAIPATSRLNVIKYANLASLLQTNELLGNYRVSFPDDDSKADQRMAEYKKRLIDLENNIWNR